MKKAQGFDEKQHVVARLVRCETVQAHRKKIPSVAGALLGVFVALFAMLALCFVSGDINTASALAEEAQSAQTVSAIQAESEDEAAALQDGTLRAKCTGLYIGKDCAADGKMIIARSEDQGNGAYAKLFVVVEAQTGTNRTIVDTGEGQNNFSVSIPDTTYKYTAVPDSATHGDGPYYASCMNECGVAVVATITTIVSDEFAAIDPFRNAGMGLREAIIPAIIACQAISAEDGVRVLASYVDKYGSQSAETILISDKNEAWIFEIYGGSTYAAMRLPSDKVAVFGNETMLGWIDFDTAEQDGFVVSANLKACLDQLESPVTDEQGRYHLAQCVSGGARYHFAHLRTWRAHQLLSPSTIGDYDVTEFYPLLFEPDEKVELFEVMELYADRYEDTVFAMELDGNESLYPIGISVQSDVHIIQTWDELPDATCQLQWLAMGNAEGCIFVPAFSGITQTYEKYRIDADTESELTESYFYVCRRNAALAATDRVNLMPGLRAFNLAQEKAMYTTICNSITQIHAEYAKSNTAGAAYVTSLADKMAAQQYAYACALYEQLSYVFLYNANDLCGDIAFEPTVESLNLDDNGKTSDDDTGDESDSKEPDEPTPVPADEDEGLSTFEIVLISAVGVFALIAIIELIAIARLEDRLPSRRKKKK